MTLLVYDYLITIVMFTHSKMHVLISSVAEVVTEVLNYLRDHS